MERPVALAIHPSIFPERARAAYLESFRTRRMNHRFHYESEKQAQQWLALHESYSPARTDDDCLRTYERAFGEIAKEIEAEELALISIGCGGGQKDLTLLKQIAASNIHYIPSDVSLPLALTAHLRATRELSLESKPALLDLPGAPDLAQFLDGLVPAKAKRVIAFFGMLPNFEPDEALRPLSAALRADDILLVSANLAPGSDYKAGVKQILSLYDNDLTRRWLATALLDAGLEISPGDIQFTINSAGDLLRIEANYCFQREQSIFLDGGEFKYNVGDAFRLFFSYRHTPALLRTLLAKRQIEIERQWITGSEEEGVFLCRKSPV